MPSMRSKENAYKKFNEGLPNRRPTKQFYVWSSKFRWAERARAYDIYKEQIIRKESEAEFIAKAKELTTEMLTRTLETVKNMPAVEIIEETEFENVPAQYKGQDKVARRVRHTKKSIPYALSVIQHILANLNNEKQGEQSISDTYFEALKRMDEVGV